MSKKSKALSKSDINKIKEMYANRVYLPTIAETLGIGIKTVLEVAHNFTEKEVYGLYYEGLTPKFIALKLGVKESIITYWISLKNAEEYVKDVKEYEYCRREYPYTWKKHRDNLIAKGKKCCKTKEEQEAKCNRLLGNEIESAFTYAGMLDTEIIKRISKNLGYKTVKAFEKAVKITGLMTDELEGIFAKMNAK